MGKPGHQNEIDCKQCARQVTRDFNSFEHRRVFRVPFRFDINKERAFGTEFEKQHQKMFVGETSKSAVHQSCTHHQQ